MEPGAPGPAGPCVVVHVDKGYPKDNVPVLIPDQHLMGRTAMVTHRIYGCAKRQHVQVTLRKHVRAIYSNISRL